MVSSFDSLACKNEFVNRNLSLRYKKETLRWPTWFEGLRLVCEASPSAKYYQPFWAFIHTCGEINVPQAELASVPQHLMFPYPWTVFRSMTDALISFSCYKVHQTSGSTSRIATTSMRNSLIYPNCEHFAFPNWNQWTSDWASCSFVSSVPLSWLACQRMLSPAYFCHPNSGLTISNSAWRSSICLESCAFCHAQC